MQRVEVQTENIDIARRVNEKEDMIRKFIERDIQQRRWRGHSEK